MLRSKRNINKLLHEQGYTGHKITSNKYKIDEYTLEFLAEKSKLEPSEITKMYTNIIDFYKMYPRLKEELDVQ